MNVGCSLDFLVKARLKRWPQRPPGLEPRAGKDAWLRGRPSEDTTKGVHPFLKLPGSNHLRTLPDGLWLNFGGTVAEPFVDIFAIEACGQDVFNDARAIDRDREAFATHLIRASTSGGMPAPASVMASSTHSGPSRRLR